MGIFVPGDAVIAKREKHKNDRERGQPERQPLPEQLVGRAHPR